MSSLNMVGVRNEKMSNKDKELGLCPLDELLPYTMHMMETMWSYDEKKQKKVIKLEDERMARLLEKKLKDDYGYPE